MIIISEIPFNLRLSVLGLEITRSHPIMRQYEEQLISVQFELV